MSGNDPITLTGARPPAIEFRQVSLSFGEVVALAVAPYAKCSVEIVRCSLAQAS